MAVLTGRQMIQGRFFEVGCEPLGFVRGRCGCEFAGLGLVVIAWS